MSNTTQLKNQRICEVGYVRCVALDPGTNQPRPVWRADRTNGKAKQSGTYQSVRPGDTIIRVQIFNDESEPVLTFETIDANGKEVTVDEGFNFRPATAAINAIMEEWLYSPKSEPFLPKGIGWDGVTPQIEKIKIDRALSFFPENMPEEIIKNIISAVRYTSINAFNNLPTKQACKGNIIDVPSGDLCIEVDENNRYVTHQDISESKEDKQTTILIADNTWRCVIVCYDKIANTSALKMAIEIVDLF